MPYSLTQLFALLSEDYEIDAPVNCAGQGELFDEAGPTRGAAGSAGPVSDLDLAFIAALYSPGGFHVSVLPESARRLFELSVNAFDAFVHAWMSEFPIQAETVRFGRKVLAAADAAGQNLPGAKREETECRAAERTAADRGDPDTQTVMQAAYKVWHETHRLMGFLRFSPDKRGVYIARCAPDHFVLPRLCEHFTQRFGGNAWIIIDEKRRLCLRRPQGEAPQLLGLDELPRLPAGGQSSPVDWENLWRHYHKTINNESRNNPALQRKCMPKRYWKYLPEL
jgi:hypothetical protein